MSESSSQTPPNELNILIFKNNLASRAFKLPISWLHRIGFLTFIVLATLFASLFLASKYYRIAETASPTRVIELEKELASLKQTLQDYKSKAPTAPVTTNPVTETAETAAPDKAEPIADAVPVPTPVATPLAIPLFSALPREYVLRPAEKLLPIELDQLRISWKNTDLSVKFNILYVNNDGKSQKGRILMLARGKDALFTYPRGALNLAGASHLVQPDNGEYFSVGRFRRTEGVFRNIPADVRIDEVQVLLLNLENQIIMNRIEKVAPRRRTAPPTRTAPMQTAGPAAMSAQPVPEPGAKPNNAGAAP